MPAYAKSPALERLFQILGRSRRLCGTAIITTKWGTDEKLRIKQITRELEGQWKTLIGKENGSLLDHFLEPSHDRAWGIIQQLLRKSAPRRACSRDEDVPVMQKDSEEEEDLVLVGLADLYDKKEEEVQHRSARNTQLGVLNTTLTSKVRAAQARILKDDIVILVLGVTGAGKSTFINYLCDEQATVGHGLASCTSQAQEFKLAEPRTSWPLRGNRVILVDTPGFDRTHTDDAETLTEINEWFRKRRRVMLGGIVYLHDVEKPFNPRWFEGSCTKNFGKTVIVPMSLDCEFRRSYEDELMTCWSKYIDQGCTVRRFEGTRESALKILDVFFARGPITKDSEEKGPVWEFDGSLADPRYKNCTY